MALEKMKLLNIIGPLSSLDKAVDVLGDSGMFQPDDAAEFYSENRSLVPLNAANESAPALDKLKTIITECELRAQIVEPEEYDAMDVDQLSQKVDEFDEKLGELGRKRTGILEQIALCDTKIDSIRHFDGLDIEMHKIRECQFIKTVFGKLPKESYKKLVNYSDNPYVDFFPCTRDDYYYWGVYVTPIEEADKIDRIFSRLYFEETDTEGLEGKPSEFIKEKEKEKDALLQEKDALDKEIAACAAKDERDIMCAFSALCQRHSYMSIKAHACKYHNSFVIVGWTPKYYSGKLVKELEEVDGVECTVTDAREELQHSPPVKLKNPFFAKPFEYYTEMYGMPNYTEIDPSGFIAITYTILFGIMFADLGQGFILLLASIFMYKVKKMPLGRLLIPCSITSMIFGTIFGSVFGFEELLTPAYRAIFGLRNKPVEVMEGNTTMILIFGAVGIGVVLLMIAMLLNIISSIKRRDIGNALFGVNGVAGLIFYASLVIGLALNLVLGVNIMTTPYILCLIVLPIILVFFREPLSKLLRGEKHIFGEGIVSFFVDNLFEMFEVALSYVTNTMSFLRVGAFILVHAGMMQVVFVLANMFGTVGFTITVFVGNIVVLVLEALLVGIQVLRLEYYEMFSRFFIGDGRKFTPVNVNDKS